MVAPHPELLRRFVNTDNLVKSGRSYLVSDLVIKYPNDYVDLQTYESMKRIMQKWQFTGDNKYIYCLVYISISSPSLK